MDEDLILGLTRQVKEEVVANYVLERRLLELQIERLDTLAEETLQTASKAGVRLTRLSSLMIAADMRSRLVEKLGIGDCGYWNSCLIGKFREKVRFISVKALTRKAKFRKIVLQSYSRLYYWMMRYKDCYEDVQKEYLAVNSNIRSFQNNFDLLELLNFIRSLDVQSIEKKRILGENFSATEIAALDENLYIRPVAMETHKIPVPLSLPEPDRFRRDLSDLAQEIYIRYPEEVRRILL